MAQISELHAADYDRMSVPRQGLRPGEISLGTTIMAFEYADGVVMAADSRTSSGTFVVCRTSDKITPLCDKIYCCRSGSAADTQAVADIVRYVLELNDVADKDSTRVYRAASLFRQICYTNKDSISAGIIVAGYDDVDGPSVYSVPLGGSIYRRKIALGGSGSQYIYGYCDANFKEGMNKEQAIEFAKNSVSLAMSRDNSSGGVIRIVVITKNDVTHSIIPGNKLPEFYTGDDVMRTSRGG